MPTKSWWHRLAARRPADQVIGVGQPYMLRWYVIPRNRFFNVYLHHFKRSDDDRALHDHPWFNLSYLLEGEYTEHTIADGGVHTKTIRKAGEHKFRSARFAHRVELHAGRCWSLFITGPRIRGWGFHCANGWVPWRQFDDRGCA